tara:strand:+ start:22157 stop:23008 length:852 start_codon:yes stop_codon:yes gene_type:complete
MLLMESCIKGEDAKYRQVFESAFNDGAAMVFKSEINRVRVNYLPEKGWLTYHFWKMEKFDENGKLFLHMYPISQNFLPSIRKQHGFLNYNINKEQFVTFDSINYYLVIKLPDFALDKVVTGQFSGKKRSWFTEVKCVEPHSRIDEQELPATMKWPNVNQLKPPNANFKSLSPNNVKESLLRKLLELKFSINLGDNKIGCYLYMNDSRERAYLMFDANKFQANCEVSLINTKGGLIKKKNLTKSDLGKCKVFMFEIDSNDELQYLQIGGEKFEVSPTSQSYREP